MPHPSARATMGRTVNGSGRSSDDPLRKKKVGAAGCGPPTRVEQQRPPASAFAQALDRIHESLQAALATGEIPSALEGRMLEFASRAEREVCLAQAEALSARARWRAVKTRLAEAEAAASAAVERSVEMEQRLAAICAAIHARFSMAPEPS